MNKSKNRKADYRVENSAGKKIYADPAGNNVAFMCFSCGLPVLLSGFLKEQGKNKDNVKNCRRTICSSKYYMEIQDDNKKFVIYEESLPAGETTDNLPPENDDALSLEQKLHHQIRANQKQFAALQQTYNRLLDFLCKLVPDKPNKKLKQTDPVKYKREKSVRKQAAAELGRFMVEFKRPVDQNAEIINAREAQYAYGIRTEHEGERLLQKLPRLRDPEERRKFVGIAEQTAKAVGFSPREFNAIVDHRMFVLLYYAAKEINGASKLH